MPNAVDSIESMLHTRYADKLTSGQLEAGGNALKEIVERYDSFAPRPTSEEELRKALKRVPARMIGFIGRDDLKEPPVFSSVLLDLIALARGDVKQPTSTTRNILNAIENSSVHASKTKQR